MTANILATILTVLVTNTVEHWAQKQEWPKYKDSDGYINLPYSVNAVWTMPNCIWYNDTNSDTMSIETTVTRQRLLSFEFENRKFSETLTNEPWMHYSVEMQRVRTNVWIDPQPSDKPGFYVVPQSLSMKTRGMDLNPQFLIETNFFVPIKTNALPLVLDAIGEIGTNMFYILNNVVTNYRVLWAATNNTNTLK